MGETPEAQSFPGRCRLLDRSGKELEASEARWELAEEAIVAHPRGGASLAVDLAEIDRFEAADFAVRLMLASGETVEASMLGRRFDAFAREALAALRAFQAQALLLEEPVGGETFEGEVARDGAPRPAQIRVWATSLSVLPSGEVPYAVPFGELVSVQFDESRYQIELTLRDGAIAFGKLGKRTQPFLRLLEARLAELRSRHAAALALLAPSVPALAGRRLAQLLPDGVPASREQLEGIAPSVWTALLENGVGASSLRHTLSELAALADGPEVAVGLKETNARQDAATTATDGEEEGLEGAESPVDGEEPTEELAEDEAPSEGPMANRVLWFAFPLLHADRARPGNAIAVEVATREGRATYLFRLSEPERYRSAPFDALRTLARERIRTLSRALVALGFKREPIYLPDERLRDARGRRYRLLLRVSEPLRVARASFLGRAIHGPRWRPQVEAALRRALEG